MERLQTKISDINTGSRRSKADTALRLSGHFGTSARFGLGLQDDFNLKGALKEKIEAFRSLKKSMQSDKPAGRQTVNAGGLLKAVLGRKNSG